MLVRDRLEAALKFVKSTCVLGSSNKITDIEKTNSFVIDLIEHRINSGSFIRVLNKWVYKNSGGREFDITLKLNTSNNDPLNDSQFYLTTDSKFLLKLALLAQKTRAGNCEMLCALLAKYLWEHPEGIDKIELVNLENYDHVFAVINRADDIPLNQIHLAKDCWIIDPWYQKGLIYSASEFAKQIKTILEFIKKQAAHTGWEYQLSTETNLNMSCYWYLNPKEDAYPTYSPDFSLDDYYDVDIHVPYGKSEFNCHGFFNRCLQELTQRTKSSIEFSQNRCVV